MVRTVAVFAILPCLLYLARKVYVSYGETQEVAVFKAHVFAVRCGAFMATAFMASFGAATSSLQLFALASAGGQSLRASPGSQSVLASSYTQSAHTSSDDLLLPASSPAQSVRASSDSQSVVH